MVEVIGAGWGRTGTLSFKTAMEILGLPCYHMKDVFENQDFKFWTRMADGEAMDPGELLQRGSKQVYRATTDFPSAIYWRELLAQYPDAKVVLTVRDPDSWYSSCVETIFRMTPNSPHMPLGIRVALWCGVPVAGFYEMSRKTVGGAIGDDWSPEAVKQRFIEHNAAVIRECPKHQLLVFRATDGWGPLCKFLGKPVPEVPYPHVNDAPQFQAIIKPINTLGWVILAAPAVALLAGTAAVWWSRAVRFGGK